jgi:hypothetical protein
VSTDGASTAFLAGTCGGGYLRPLGDGRRAMGGVMVPFNGVKVFSTTLARDRDQMGESITRWLAAHPALEIVDREVRQSSDKEFHCLTITLFYREREA